MICVFDCPTGIPPCMSVRIAFNAFGSFSFSLFVVDSNGLILLGFFSISTVVGDGKLGTVSAESFCKVSGKKLSVE